MRKTGLVHILLLCSIIVRLHSATYYVSTNGNDSNPGTSAAPWRRIQKAADSVVAGDIVRVRPGTYEERVSETTSGTASNFITYVSDTPKAAILRGFYVSGSYVRIIAFRITHVSNTGYEGIRVSGGKGVQILDNLIHNVSASGAGSGITYGNADFLIIRGNKISYTGSPGNNFGPGAKAIGNIYDSGGATPALIEYNEISHTTDYLTPEGGMHIYRNNVLGPTTTQDFGGTPHVDGYQPNEGTVTSFMESNWHVDNAISDSHLYLDEIEANHHITLIRNVSIRSGDRLCVQWRVSDNHLAAHNTIGQVGYGPRGGPGSGGVFYVWDNSINNVSRNNIFTNATSGSSIYAIASGGSLVTDHDLSWPLGNASIKADPRFVDYGANDFRIRSESPAVNNAGALTTVTMSGSGFTIPIMEPYWFYDGFGLTEGQKIYVGDDNGLTVTSVNYANKTLTISSSISFATGESVGYAYLGTGPDIGAYEEGAKLVTSGTLISLNGEYTVVPVGDARFVTFYAEGVPVLTDFTAPYTATLIGAITAKVFPLHPQAQPVIDAIPDTGTGSEPTAPTNLRIVAE